MGKFYVYTHTKVGDTTPFYVGKGYGKRAHSKSGRSAYWKNVAKSGYNIEFEFEHLDEATALQMEKDMIQMWGRRNLGTGCLVNLTDGGDGVSGKVYTEAERQTKRAQLRGNKHLLGHKHTEESRQKMSRAVRLARDTTDYRKKLSESIRGIKRSSETRTKMSISAKNRSASYNENMSRAKQRFQYTVISPEGKIFFVNDMKAFCSEHNLSQHCMRGVARGVQKQHKGYTVSRTLT